MNRRSILLGGVALASAPSIRKFTAAAQPAAPDPSRLNGDLTPLGGERAASKSGLVPEWTGEGSTPPPGWTPDMLPPDLFGDEKPLFSVTASNMSQYEDLLSEGQIQMFKRFGGAGYRMDVYPTHRTGCAPQYVYDNTAKNVTRAVALPGGLVQGFTGAVGGPPFPILSDDPATAGLQAMWNHATAWGGYFQTITTSIFVVGNGQRTLTNGSVINYKVAYYDPEVTPETLPRYYAAQLANYVAPANQAGGKFLSLDSLQPLNIPNVAYEYLVGEGRIREAPAVQYDIPSSVFGDAVNYDEFQLFFGAFDRYTWKLVGKKEVIVPYNQHKLFMVQPAEALGDQFLNPDLVRFEVHRCWVVEAHLAPGARMTEPVRRFYVDEDSWLILMSDAYDDQGNYWKYGNDMNQAQPALPGLASIGPMYYNLQEGIYAITATFYSAPAPLGGNISFDPVPVSKFEPQSMANSGGL